MLDNTSGGVRTHATWRRTARKEVIGSAPARTAGHNGNAGTAVHDDNAGTSVYRDGHGDKVSSAGPNGTGSPTVDEADGTSPGGNHRDGVAPHASPWTSPPPWFRLAETQQDLIEVQAFVDASTASSSAGDTGATSLVGSEGHGFASRFRARIDARLWFKLGETRRDLVEAREFVAATRPNDPLARATIVRCNEAIGKARDILEHTFIWNGPPFWDWIHAADNYLLLIAPPSRVAQEALRIKDEFARNISQKELRETWVPRITAAADRLNPPSSDAQASGLGVVPSAEERSMLRMASELLNRNTDTNFQNLGAAALIQLASALVLLLLVGVSFAVVAARGAPADQWPGYAVAGFALLLGAAGALVSNVMPKSQFKIPYGQFVSSILYYMLLVPLIGAVSALFMIALEATGILFTLSSVAPSAPKTPIVIVVGATAEVLARAILAFVSGFFGDRLLRDTLEKVRDRLFGVANKETSA